MKKAQATRMSILQKAFELIYRKGYQATSIDEILAEMKVTKGAFFYHFSNKEEMGLAMIKEIMVPGMERAMIEPLLDSSDPVEEIYLMMKHLLLANPFFEVKYGCPAINLIDEMAALNPAFNEALSELVRRWEHAIESSLKKGTTAGKIRKEVNNREATFFIISGYGGIRNLGKIYGKAVYTTYLRALQTYLKSLQ